MINRRQLFAGIIGFIGATALKPFAKAEVYGKSKLESVKSLNEIRTATGTVSAPSLSASSYPVPTETRKFFNSMQDSFNTVYGEVHPYYDLDNDEIFMYTIHRNNPANKPQLDKRVGRIVREGSYYMWKDYDRDKVRKMWRA